MRKLLIIAVVILLPFIGLAGCFKCYAQVPDEKYKIPDDHCPNNHCQDIQHLIGNISLSYDSKTNVLHVTAEHLSFNWSVDYIRMMTVALNGQIVATQNYAMQHSAEAFSDDVPLNAQKDDVISADLYSTQGSSKSLDLTVTNEDVSSSSTADSPNQ